MVLEREQLLPWNYGDVAVLCAHHYGTFKHCFNCSESVATWVRVVTWYVVGTTSIVHPNVKVQEYCRAFSIFALRSTTSIEDIAI